jgi:hypothetical protein
VTVSTSADGVLVVVDHPSGEQAIHSPWISWSESLTRMHGGDLHHLRVRRQACGLPPPRWVDPKTIELSWRFPETAFRDTVQLRFHGNRLTWDRHTNANSGRVCCMIWSQLRPDIPLLGRTSIGVTLPPAGLHTP